MAYFHFNNAKIKAVAASVPDDVEYTNDYNEVFVFRVKDRYDDGIRIEDYI